MTNDNKRDNPGANPTTGKDNTTTSIETEAQNQKPRDDGDGQQGAGGLGGLTERSTPNPKGSQPHLGGAHVPDRGSSAGTGFTEKSDPTSREGAPNFVDSDKLRTNNPD